MTIIDLTLYYNSSDLSQYQNVQETNLYSDLETTKVAGIAISNLFTTILNSSNNVDIESVTYFIGDDLTDCIFFNYSLYDKSVGNKFSPGYYIFPITGGQGIYLNAKGNVYIYVSGAPKFTRYVRVIGEAP